MPLSEHEQKMLDEMERQLFADDPKLARAFRADDRPRHDRRRIGLGLLGVAVGLGLLVLAVALPAIWLGVLAFLIMLAGAIFAITAPAIGPDVAASSSAGPARRARAATSSGAGAPQSDLLRRMEERWDRRSDEGRG